MKKVILFLMFVPVLVSGQINSDFESGNINNWTEGTGGHWKADTLRSITGNYSLHEIFDNPASGSDCTGIPLTDLFPSEGLTRWTFRVRHGYDPSSSNNWAAYLMSDTEPGLFANGSGVSGYAAGVNLSGYDDTLRLWKIKTGTASVIISCPVNWQNDIGTDQAAQIIVERTTAGSWTISVFDQNEILKGAASGQDNELFSPVWFVLNYRYTSTCDRLLWFDDFKIEGVFHKDITPPEIVDMRITGRKSISLSFNEEPSVDALVSSNFLLNSGINPVTKIEKRSTSVVRICFRDEFQNKESNSLIIKYLCDRSGNCAGDITKTFVPAWAEPGDVIISEIMADPIPPVSLPPKEYLEIANRSGFTFNLDKWRLSAGDLAAVLPPVIIEPGGYITVCSQPDTSLFSEYSKTAGVKSFPVLTDDGRLLVLYDTLGNLIHGVEYSPEWYGDALKTGGGWSLEMTDISFPFFSEGNWEASLSKKGGTPGNPNSADRSNPDQFFKGINNVFPVSDKIIRVEFSEPLIDLPANPDHISIDGSSIKSITPEEPLMRNFGFGLMIPLVAGKIYTLTIPVDIKDYAGNSMERRTFGFGIPVKADKSDIVFNELLFNPYPEEQDYIEFVNCSDKILDASQLYLASINSETGDTSDVKSLSGEGRCILPGSFYAVTTDCSQVLKRYHYADPDALFKTTSMPSMPDDRGHLILLNREMELIDEVIYTEEMHFPLLAGKEGVSLEKIRPELRSDERLNWHSASESYGWGTPGRENSIFTDGPEGDDRVILSSGKISPDNDGFEDVLVIDINPEGIGNVISITVFDETGSFIRKVCENFFAGTRASIIWDGTASDNSPVRTGIYIVLIDLYNDMGKTKSWKKVCTVVRNR